MTDLLLLPVLLPLAGAVATAVLPWRRSVGLAVAAAQLGLAVAAAVAVLRHGPLTGSPGGWEPPLGIALRLDGLGAAVGLLAAVVVLAVLAHAAARPGASGGPAAWPLTLATVAGLQAVLVSGDLFTTYVALELLTVGAVGLVALGGRRALAPALRYLCVAVLGSFAFLVAVALVYARTGTLTLELAADTLPPGPALAAVLALAVVGLGVKAALAPLHAWLPDAHASAPTTVSPLLSALVVKGSVVVLVRLWTALGGHAGLAVLLAVLGSGAVLWGGVLALRQTRLKRLVAYSTVAQVGYLVLLLPLVLPALDPASGGSARAGAALAWQGGLLLLLAHGLAKAAMFLAAGTLVGVVGGDRVADLAGAATRAPMVVLTFGVAGACLAGLPPSLGFVGKWRLLEGAIASGAWWAVAVLLAGGLLTAAATARVLGVALRPDPDRGADAGTGATAGAATGAATGAADARPAVPAGARWPALTLALLAVGTGVGSAWLVDLLLVGAVPA